MQRSNGCWLRAHPATAHTGIELITGKGSKGEDETSPLRLAEGSPSFDGTLRMHPQVISAMREQNLLGLAGSAVRFDGDDRLARLEFQLVEAGLVLGDSQPDHGAENSTDG